MKNDNDKDGDGDAGYGYDNCNDNRNDNDDDDSNDADPDLMTMMMIKQGPCPEQWYSAAVGVRDKYEKKIWSFVGEVALSKCSNSGCSRATPSH